MEYQGRGDWVRESYLELLCDKMQAVAEGRLKRLMVFLPPRHGKSEICSKKFPAWYEAKYPQNPIIMASYGADLAQEFSGVARDTVAGERELWPDIRIHPTVHAKARWAIEGYPQGGVIAAGVGGPITGRGAMVGIIDDPVKDYEQAHSETYREAVWSWYRTTFRTRIHPGGAIVLIMTRWHEDDLAGRLIEQEKAGGKERWEIINLPAEAEEDDPLGREKGEYLSKRWPAEELASLKEDHQTWISLYQQRPRPEEGDYFKAGWFNPIDLPDPDRNWRRYGGGIVLSAADLSIGEKETNDWVVMVTGLLTPQLEAILLDVRRFRVSDPDYSAFEIASEAVGVQRLFNPAVFGFEDGQIFKSIWPVIRSEALEAKVQINERALQAIRDKQARARTAQAWMRKGRCFFPNAPWLEDFQDELKAFPNGKWDDQVDAYAWLMILMHEIAGDIDKYSGLFR